MATFTKQLLSGSTSGVPILVVAVATLGDTIHTAHATALDEIWLYAQNADTVSRTLTIEFGGVSDPDDLVDAMTILPNSGLVTVIPGIVLTGGLVITAFASAASQINIFGFVNRIT